MLTFNYRQSYRTTMTLFLVNIWLMVSLLKAAKACGGNFTSPTGVLRSPNYPNPYPNNIQCVYLISQPIGHNISLTFTTFSIENETNCQYDYLEIRDGCTAVSPLIGKFCEEKVPSSVTTASNCMHLLFYADDNKQKKGFEAVYGLEEKDCTNLVAPVAGYLSSTHGTSVTVACNRNNTVSGDPTLTCLYGSWSGTVGTCETDCTELTSPAHGSLFSTSTVNGTVAIVSCNTNYTLVGESTFMCRSGSWSGVVGICEADCTHLSNPANGSLSSCNTSHGTVVTVSCDAHYTLVGEHILQCISGSWSGTIGNCEADCTGLSAPTNGSLSSISVGHGTYVTVSCYANYTLVGERTLQCMTGLLAGTIGTCEADCTGLSAPTNGLLSSISVGHGTYVTVSCDVNYTLIGERTLQCMSGLLAGTIGTCEADCTGLSAPYNGSLSSVSVVHGTYVTVSCDANYTLVGERSLQCMSGLLAGIIGFCEADCTNITIPAHGYLSSYNITHGTVVTISCDANYTLVGESTLQCMSGSLSGTIGTCEKDCTGLSAPPNGSLSSVSVAHGTYVTVSCDANYTLVGEWTLQCMSGSLAGTIGTCKTDCTNITIPAHGHLPSYNITHGTVVTISCDANYTLVGESTLQCMSGSLSGTIGTCEKDCTGIIAPNNGSLSSVSVAHGTYVTVSCDANYTLVGKRNIQCMSGLLAGTIGTCEPDCTVLSAPTNGSLSSISVVHGSYVTLSCDANYTLIGERTLPCMSGLLAGSIGTCEADCANLTSPAHGSLSPYNVNHGTVVTISCDTNYTRVGERTLQCMSGSWSGTIATCEEDCAGLSAPLHGSLSSRSVVHGTYVSISCEANYTLVGERTLHCMSGILTGNIGTCETDCTGLTEPRYGSISSTEVAHGRSVTVSCNEGYRLAGESSLSCMSGTLSGIVGTCEAVPISSVVLQDGENQLDNFAVINATEGSPKTLECVVDQTVLVTFFLWYIGDQLLQNDTDRIITFIPEMADHDKHVFCNAYNLKYFDQAVQSVSPRLYVFGRPVSPRIFIFTGSSGENASFYWTSGYNGGYSQWFILQYRGVGELDWINSSIREELTSNPDDESTFVEYRAQISNMTHGEYQARVVAGNKKGEATPIYLKTDTFQMLSVDSSFSSVIGKELTTILVGAASGAVILILIGVIIFQRLRFKRTPSKGRNTVSISLDEKQMTQNNYDGLCKSSEKGNEDNKPTQCPGGDTSTATQVHVQEIDTENTYDYLCTFDEKSKEEYEAMNYSGSNTSPSKHVHNQEPGTQENYENLKIG